MQTVSFEKPIIESRLGLITFIFLCGCNGLIAQDSTKAPSVIWAKHTVMEQGHCNTAIAIDVNQDKAMDVIASFNGRVSLFIAPNWKEVVLYRFAGRNDGCIHSTAIDADADGDLDWAGTIARAVSYTHLTLPTIYSV